MWKEQLARSWTDWELEERTTKPKFRIVRLPAHDITYLGVLLKVAPEGSWNGHFKSSDNVQNEGKLTTALWDKRL